MRQSISKFATILSILLIGVQTIFTLSCSGGDDGGDISSGSVPGISSSSGSLSGGGGSCNISSYRTKKIGNQTWMLENLNCDVSGSKCYDNDPANCTKYGRMYNWSAAKSACSGGWHLPSDEEWQTLVDFVGGKETAGKKLKATDGWKRSGNGTDDYDFSALPGGLGYSDGSFGVVGDHGYWWSATPTEYDDSHAYSRSMLYYSTGVSGPGVDSFKSYYLSVRCVKD